MFLRQFQVKIVRRFCSSAIRLSEPQVCVIGSGPAGFYTAQHILKNHPSAQVDIYEKLPVPFGLVRYGVAPDHPEVKNCINTFTQAAANDRLSFIGNVSVGNDVTIKQLQEAYHAIVLAYGAARDRKFNIPGEELSGVLSARRFVGWYNGLPEDMNLDVDLSAEEVAVFGQGNVALDVARILLKPVDELRKTDTPEVVLEALNSSKVKRVILYGRRNPEHVAFTIKELREMVNLPNARPYLFKEDFSHLRDLIPSAPRARKRLLELLAKTALDDPSSKQSKVWSSAPREWGLRFCTSPKEILPNNDGTKVAGVTLIKNRITDDQKAEATDEIEKVDCDLILRSIGYTSVQIDTDIPFDDNQAVVPNIQGRVKDKNGMYVSGWLASGPVGVLQSTMTSAFTTGKALLDDITANNLDVSSGKPGRAFVHNILQEKGVETMSFKDWCKLDQYEIETGTKLNKPREKVISHADMIKYSKHS